MSQLGKGIRSWLRTRTGYDTKFPGDISVDVAPAGVAKPYGVYVGTNSQPITKGVSGVRWGDVETISLIITADLRSDCETILDWVQAQLAPSLAGWTTTASPGRVIWWRIGSASDVSEVLVDGSDESIRQVTLEVTGFVIAP